MEGDNHIKTANGAYGHFAEIELTDGKCDLCQTEGKVLSIDTSEREYARLEICKACILARFS